MSKKQMIQARELIKQKRYDEALIHGREALRCLRQVSTRVEQAAKQQRLHHHCRGRQQRQPHHPARAERAAAGEQANELADRPLHPLPKGRRHLGPQRGRRGLGGALLNDLEDGRAGRKLGFLLE